jgi:hypothetical protein
MAALADQRLHMKKLLYAGLALALAGACNTALAALPTKKATSLTFTDTDLYRGTIGGPVKIGRATDESKIKSYVLRWGLAGGCSAANSFIAEIPKTGSDLTWNMAPGTKIPGAVYELLVYTKNASGEMLTCQSTRATLKDVVAAAPRNLARKVRYTFTTPANPQDVLTRPKSEGIEIWPAANESDITHYRLYWGDAAGNKLGIDLAPLLARIPAPKDGKILRWDFPDNMATETGAIYVLVCSENYGQEYCGPSTTTNGRTVDKISKSDPLRFLGIIGDLRNGISANNENSCPGLTVMETCGDNACNGTETAQSCPSDCSSYNTASFNYQVLCNQVQTVYRPSSVAELQNIVANASAQGQHVKVVGGAGPNGTTGSASGVVCSDGVVISMENINENNPNFTIGLEQFEGQEVVNVPAGANLHNLGEWLYARGKGLGFAHLGWRHPSVAGAIGTSTHGSSPSQSNVLAHRVVAMDLITADGQYRSYSAGTTGVTDPDLWKSLTTHLGLLGIITQVKLRVEPAFNLQVRVTFHDENELLDAPSGTFAEIAECDYGQYNWFPSINKVMKTCGLKTSLPADANANNALLWPYVDMSQFSVQETVQSYQLGACLPDDNYIKLTEELRYNGWLLTPPLTKDVDNVKRYSSNVIGPAHRMMSSPLIDVGRKVFQMDWEVAVPAQNLEAAMQYVRNFTNGQNLKARQVGVPMIGIFVRYAKSENKTLMAYTGTGGPFQEGTHVVHIEMPIWVPVGMDEARFQNYIGPYEEAMRTLITQYGARGHWGKNMHSNDPWLFEMQRQTGSYDYDNRLQRFNSKVGQLDPNGMFANPMAKAIGIQYPNFTYPASW